MTTTRSMALLLPLLLASCSSMPTLAPHKIEVQQGNYVTQEMVAKLKPGMTKSQVRFILGTPLITDAFHQSRWDYVYRLEKGGEVAEQRKLAVIFDGDKLLRLEGDVIPASAAPRDPSAAPKPMDKVESKPAAGGETQLSAKRDTEKTEETKDKPKEKEPKEKGFFGRMLEKIGL